MTFREIEQGQLFTSFLENRTQTAVKVNEKTAIILETGKFVSIHHNQKTEQVGAFREKNVTLGETPSGETVLYYHEGNGLTVLRILVLGRSLESANAVKPLIGEETRKTVDKSVDIILRKIERKMREAVNLLPALRDGLVEDFDDSG